MNVRIVENEKQMLEAMKDSMETIWVKGDYADKAFDSVSKAEGVVKQALEALEDNLTTGKQPFPSDVIIGIGVENTLKDIIIKNMPESLMADYPVETHEPGTVVLKKKQTEQNLFLQSEGESDGIQRRTYRGI